MINLKQLLTENTTTGTPRLTESDHVRNGLQKVFAAGDPEISYRRCENVGLGYIKSISEAIKISVDESRKVAKMFNYRDDAANKRFIKEDNDFSKIDAQSPEGAMAKQSSEEMPHDETDMSNPEEKREVQIGKRLMTLASQSEGNQRNRPEGKAIASEIRELAQELLTMHGVK